MSTFDLTAARDGREAGEFVAGALADVLDVGTGPLERHPATHSAQKTETGMINRMEINYRTTLICAAAKARLRLSPPVDMRTPDSVRFASRDRALSPPSQQVESDRARHRDTLRLRC